MSGSQSDNLVILALQRIATNGALLESLFSAGIKVTTQAAAVTSTVAALPASAPAGTLMFASNGRANASQGAGSGAGCLVCGNGTAWIAVWSGVAVTA